MSFVIDFDGRLDEAIRRAVHVELTRAVANLTLPPDRLHEGVHEARKSFKRLRAFYRLVAAADPAAAKREIARFRAIAGSLAEARDAAAMVEAFDRLEAAFPDEAAGSGLASVGNFLAHRRNAAARADADTHRHAAEAVAACRAAYASIDAFSLPGKRAAVEKLLASGFAATMRKLRRALKAARRDDTAESIHDLRKRVKDHLYHLGLLRGILTDAAYRSAVDDLGERLGDHNDCAVLAGVLGDEAPGLSREESGAKALSLLARQADALGEEAVAEAGRLFDRRPSAWRKIVRKNARKARGRGSRERSGRVAAPSDVAR